MYGALLLPDGRVLSWSRDETLPVWDVATGEGRALTGHAGSVRGALLLPDGRVLSWGDDWCVRRQPTSACGTWRSGLLRQYGDFCFIN